jgi:hypothetical protein
MVTSVQNVEDLRLVAVNVEGWAVTSGDPLLQDGVRAACLLAQYLESALIAQDANDSAPARRMNDWNGRFHLRQKVAMLVHSTTRVQRTLDASSHRYSP